MTSVEQWQHLLPHSGAMCLLNGVNHWDESTIVCSAISHCCDDNPLREGGILPVHVGIEYAAQAMAIHGSLCAAEQGEPRRGYLAVLSRVEWMVNRLDQLDDVLSIRAEKLMSTADGSNYLFQLHCQEQLLLEGEAVVVLQP